jgi:hypothetical protein
LGMAVSRQQQRSKGCQTRRDGTAPVWRRVAYSGRVSVGRQHRSHAVS